jgi:CheY-like chemotaxis protein/HPt (histidine-containing phosphotransfer) domain-containing protein
MTNSAPLIKTKSAHQLSGAQILVVDDNHASRLVAKAILEREGCVVSLANNGLSSVTLATHNSFDLILMDIQMPDISGMEATRRIKTQSKSNAATPIIALTAYSDKEIQDEAHKVGIVETLTKPLRVGQMQSALSRLQGQSESSTTPAAPLKLVSPPRLNDIETLNISIIKPLAETASPEMLAKLYERFNHSADSFLRTIEESEKGLDKNDANADALGELRKAAHALKGAASSVGFAKLSAQAARIQNANINELVTAYMPLRDLVDEANTELATYLARPKADP